MNGLVPEGWSISPVDFSLLVAVFEPLGLRPGLVLRAYQYLEAAGGHSIVWAMPERAPFPKPEQHSADPAPPPEALAHPMQAIEGDGSAFAYLCASVFAREAASVGAFGHGARWSEFEIVGEHPAPPAPEHGRQIAWRWIDREPTDWRPTVTEHGDSVVVRIYARTELGGERIVSLVDTYRDDQYTLSSSESIIATGGSGYTP
jgi:hypothetical protein